MTFLEILEKTLLKDARFVSEDSSVLKAKVYDAAMAMDDSLLELLLSDRTLKEHFFKEVKGTLVFDKVQFTWVLNSREFLPDSFTMYKNKIGLADDKGDMVSQKNDVTLIWPYKDCVLEGGQTKEDEERDEIFYNETLAPDQVTRLLYPKVLCNAKRYAYNGELDLTGQPAGIGSVSCMPTTEFLDTDNLILKGNNLLALSSLLQCYRDKVKFIYIDPPYNTKNDTFGYNDSFNQSTWLTFMKDRLVLAREFLSRDGSIFVSIDGNEFDYLSILMKDVFGAENLLEVFHFQVRYANKSLNERDDFQPIIEYGFAYAKDKNFFKPNKPTIPYETSKFCFEIRELSKPDRIFFIDKKRKVEVFKRSNYSIEKVADDLTDSLEFFKETWITGSIYSDTGHGTMYRKAVEPFKNLDGVGSLYKIDGLGEDGLGFRYMTNPAKQSGNYGKMFTKVPLNIKEEILSGEYEKSVPIVNFYDISADVGNIRHEGGVTFNKGKKPEKMLYNLLSVFTNENDLVLDFFMGSGTTAAVAHKMLRRYIGIEQMDYIKDKTLVRLKDVICGEQTGVSNETNWHGGGSFVYGELAERSETLAGKLQLAENSEAVLAVLDQATDDGLLRPSILPDDLKKTRDDFLQFSLQEQKQLVMELLDKNKLYINLCDLDDEEMQVSEEDRAFTRSFYGMDKDTEALNE